MNLAEDLDFINKKLFDDFGTELLAGSLPKFRVVWADDQLEKRWVTHTPEGFQLIHKEVQEVPKYSTYIKERYVLERLVPRLPDSDVVDRVVYEPIWTFCDVKGEYLPPRLDVAQLVIETMFSQISKAGTFKKYKDPSESPEHRAKLINDMYATLFANETDTADALRYREGVVNPAEAEHFSGSSGGYLKAESLGDKTNDSL